MSQSATHPNAYVSLGSNLGDRMANLELGIRGMVEQGLNATRRSPIYETEAVETFLQPPFLNMVVELGGDLPPPEELMKRLLRVEQSLGRIRDQAKGPRPIDLDLLLFGNQTCQSQLLTLPHPRLEHRKFVLVPLAELCPDVEHPRLHRSISDLLLATADESCVRLWIPENNRHNMPLPTDSSTSEPSDGAD